MFNSVSKPHVRSLEITSPRLAGGITIKKELMEIWELGLEITSPRLAGGINGYFAATCNPKKSRNYFPAFSGGNLL